MGTFRMRKPRAIVLNIEGTTTDRSFLSRALFPFFRNNVGHFFKDTVHKWTTGQMVDRLRAAQVRLEKRCPMPNGPKAMRHVGRTARQCARIVYRLYQCEPNAVELKELRLLMWVWAIEKRLLVGHVFEEVAKCMHVWKHHNQIALYAHSSASSLIQKLLFVHCTNGNLLSLVQDFLDHKFGSKSDTHTYNRIAAYLNLNVADILYITDRIQEGHSAAQAGLKVAIIQRATNKTKLHSKLHSISSLEDIYFKM